MPESSVSGDGVRRLFSHDHRHSSLPVFSGVALGGAIPWIWLAIPAASATHTLSRPEGCSPRCFRFRRTAAANRLNPIPPALSPTVFPVPLRRRAPGKLVLRRAAIHRDIHETVNLRTAPSRTYVFRKFLLRKFIRLDADYMRKSTSLTGTKFGSLAACTTTRAVSRKRFFSRTLPGA